MTRSAAPALLPILRSETQADVLTRLLLTPAGTQTVRDIAEATGRDAWSVRREIRRLVLAGIVEREDVGGTAVFRAAEDSPLVGPLRTLLERSVGAEAMLRAALGDTDGVEAAALFGSWARGEVNPASDLDLLVVGDVNHASLIDALSPLERRLSRQIDLIAMTAAEFEARMADGSAFLADILAQPRRPLVGELPGTGGT